MKKRDMFKLAFTVSLQPTEFSSAVYMENFNKACERLSGLGYHGIELAIRDPSQVNLKEINESISRYRLKIPAIGTGQGYIKDGLSLCHPDSKIRRRTKKRLMAHIDFASHFKSNIIIGLTRGHIEKDVNTKKRVFWVVATVKQCCQYAKEKGVKILLEPINRYETNFINTLEEGQRFIERVAEDNLLLLIDTFHMNIEESSIIQSIEKFGPLIGHVHIADSNRKAPGLGHIDFSSIIIQLLEVNYSDFLSAEVIPYPNFEEASRLTIEFYRKISSRLGIR